MNKNIKNAIQEIANEPELHKRCIKILFEQDFEPNIIDIIQDSKKYFKSSYKKLCLELGIKELVHCNSYCEACEISEDLIKAVKKAILNKITPKKQSKEKSSEESFGPGQLPYGTPIGNTD